MLILLSESGGLTPIMFDLLNVDLLEVRQANETTLVKQEHTCISKNPLEDVPSAILEKFGEMGVKKIWFTGEGLLLFPNLPPHKTFSWCRPVPMSSHGEVLLTVSQV